MPQRDIMANRKICVVGLGYVGLRLLVRFGMLSQAFGYDRSGKRIDEIKNCVDSTCEVDNSDIRKADLVLSADPSIISGCDFIIVAVPTPVDKSKMPDLGMLKSATKTVGAHLSKGSIVVYESTVYPGATEEVCVPILEQESGLKFGRDFKVGYSPERISPGDREHTVEKIKKVVSGCDMETLDAVAEVYGSIIKAGICRVSSIRVAEAVKVTENSQRDVNIAFVNELKVIFDRMGIDTEEVLMAARTKWNFLDFHPGLVGGECIGVDPYYLAYKADEIGHDARLIKTARKVNEDMSAHMASLIVKGMKDKGVNPKGAKVLVLGATFKPNVKDLRNSKVEDLIGHLKGNGIMVDVFDPMISERKEVFGCENVGAGELKTGKYDYVVMAVNHRVFSGMGIKPDFAI
jgi:UDP-N-acetyl-D-glucosamine/UDP-N-acetyl-D-galactosamine dehydrogenase